MTFPRTTLEGLRARIDYVPVPPARLTPAKYRSLDEAARRTYDDQRLAWFGGGFVFDTTETDAVRKAVRRYRISTHPLALGGERLAFLDGEANSGKTTLLMQVAADVERSVHTQHPSFRAEGIVPVVYIEMMPRSTPKMVARSILDFFGTPYSDRGTQTALTQQAVLVLRKHQTQVLIVDELQMLRLDGSTGDDAINGLKSIINGAGLVTLLSGADVQARLRSAAAAQLLRRGSTHRLDSHHYANDEGRLRWANLVDAFAQQMRLVGGDASHLRKHADLLFHTCEGRIGDLRRVLSTAMSLMLDEKESPAAAERISTVHLSAAGVDVDLSTTRQRRRGAA